MTGETEEITGENMEVQKEEESKKKKFETGTIFDDIFEMLRRKKEVDLYDEILPG